MLDSGAPAAVNDLCAALAGKLAAIVLTAEQTGQVPNTTSLQLRRAIEELKARIMQELSVLRRALRTAELDHYALAACAHGLTTHPNRSLLLDIMHREYLVSQTSDDARDVLAILRAEFAMPA